MTSTPVARAGIAAMETHFGLHGHTHLPIAYIEEDGRLETMSPGSGSRADVRRASRAAQPRQRRPAARRDPDRGWMLLDTDAETATWRRTAYDVADGPGGDDEAVGLPERLVARLAYGL